MRCEKLTKKILFFVSILLSINITVNADVNATDANATLKKLFTTTGQPTIIKKYQDANSSQSDYKKFNTKDWESQFSQNGLTNTSNIGNTNALFGSSKMAEIASSGDINSLKTEELLKNKDINQTKSIGAFNRALQNVVMNNVIISTFGKPSAVGRSIKCYITRDLGTTYRCTAPNNSLMVSSSLDGQASMEKLKQQCQSQCFVQNSCVDMRSNLDENKTTSSGSKAFALSSSSPTAIFKFTTDTSLTLKTITISEGVKKYPIRYYVSYINSSGKNISLVERLLSSSDANSSKILYIGDIVGEITVKIDTAAPYTNSANNGVINDIKLSYNSNAKWICPNVQDITNLTVGDFAYVCRSGKKTSLTRSIGMTSKTYDICAQSIYPGQNIDGSFYQKNSCESVCRQQYGCEMLRGGAINFESLKGFREGCIENASLSCSNFNNDCKKARNNPDAKVINELAFKANMSPVSTIIKGVTTGVERPRLSLDEASSSIAANGTSYSPNDLQFQKQKLEEWKDDGYSNMMKNANWNVSNPTFGDSTLAEHAYGINLKTGAFYGYLGTSMQALMWKLKPASHDVGSGVRQNLYAVIKLIVQNTRQAQVGDGTKKEYFDEIWYVKAAGVEQFTPFYYISDAYDRVMTKDDYGLPYFTYNKKLNATGKYVTFSGNSWYDISQAQVAPAFTTDDFSSSKAYWEYEVIENIEGKGDSFKGLIRWVENYGQANEVVHYDGTPAFGTATVIVKTIVSVGYTTSTLTLENLKSMSDNKQLTTIHETGSENAYSRSFKGDGEKNNNVILYMYGKENSASSFVNIKPNKEEIGRKGFIYVFGQ